VANTAVFKGGKLIGELNKAETRGLLWINGKIQSGSMNVDALGGRISMGLLESSASVDPVLKDGRFSIHVSVRQALNVAEADITDNIMKVENEDRMNAISQDTILAALKASVDRAKALNADVFGFGEAIRRKYPGQSKNFLENWDSEFPKLEVNFSVTAVVRSTGSMAEPVSPGGIS
jgi:spore germination protein KC